MGYRNENSGSWGTVMHGNPKSAFRAIAPTKTAFFAQRLFTQLHELLRD
jgi:hypothetical protein